MLHKRDTGTRIGLVEKGNTRIGLVGKRQYIDGVSRSAD
jgi:hypothetical protein